MAEPPSINDSPLSGLLEMPKELLGEVASTLSVPDLRHLGRANHALSLFVSDYLGRLRYRTGLLSLPKEVLLRIVQHLPSQKDRSRFARVSYRIYPLVMTYIVCYDLRHTSGCLLIHAARANDEAVAKKIIQLSKVMIAKNDTKLISSDVQSASIITSIMAPHGDDRILRLFLQAGIELPVNEDVDIPLAIAIVRRRESMATMLSQEISASHRMQQTNITVLQLAVVHNLANIVEKLLEREGDSLANNDQILDRSLALWKLIQRTFFDSRFDVKSDCPGTRDEVYQIAKMLLKYGANPDLRIINDSQYETTREIACKHPDPRIRVLMPQPHQTKELKVNSNNPSSARNCFLTRFLTTKKEEEEEEDKEYAEEDRNSFLYFLVYAPKCCLPRPRDEFLKWGYKDRGYFRDTYSKSWLEYYETHRFYPNIVPWCDKDHKLGESDLAVVIQSDANRMRKIMDIFT